MPNVTAGNVVASSNQLGADVVTSPKILDGTVAESDVGTNAINDDEVKPHTTSKILVPLANLLNSGGTTGDLIVWNGSNWVKLPAVAAGLFLQSQGVGVAPAYGAASGKLYASGTSVLIENTTTETDIFTFSLAGGVLGTTGAIKGRVNVVNRSGSGGAINFTYRLYYGATVIASVVHNETGNAKDGFIDFQIYANASASAQLATMLLSLSTSNLYATTPANVVSATGSAAINSANAQTLKMTLQMSSTGASYGKTFQGMYVSVI